MKTLNPYLIFFLAIFFSCSEDEPIVVDGVTGEKPIVVDEDAEDQLTIYFVNDQHGELNSFAKIKHIVDKEREENNVLLVCAGDIFSGNPIVDQHSEKGYPMIDIMNKTGFDVAVIGNHEYDYGLEILKERMEQAEFDFICANMNVQSTSLPQPPSFKTFTVADLKITFLGFVETNGKPDDVIPSTHPWRVDGLRFERYTEVVDQFADLKQQEDADLLIALTHLGTGADISLASQYPFFDLIIGGHSHQIVNEKINGIDIVQSGANLSHLGKIVVKLENKEVVDTEVTFIDLDNYSEYDQELMTLIDSYNNAPEFDEVIGYSYSHHGRDEVGCFYTTALKDYLNVDVSFQNGGGIRASIDEGDITKMEIYNMDPFNNYSVVFTMTVDEIRDFFIQSNAALHVTGINLQWSGQQLIITDENGNELPGSEFLTIGMNDYIPAVYEAYFPLEKADIKNQTTAEAIIDYLETVNSEMDYDGCSRYFSN